MLIVEHIKLLHLRTLVKTAAVELQLFAHESGSLVLASTMLHPEGLGYYVITDALLSRFTNNLLTLQEIFDLSPSAFVEIVRDGEAKLYLRYDIDSKVAEGDKTLSRLLTTG
ncbi:MAG TPA: hypothetical protein PKM63_18005 [Panacibacter sp.]|nr:hypothetical protein [Panacibacter sp.]